MWCILEAIFKVPANGSVHDAVCFFCSVKVDGEVQGDLVVFFGGIHLAGSARHDVVDFFGGVDAEDDASIGQDLVAFFGSVRLGENVTVGKDIVAMFGSVHTPDSVSVGHSRVVQPMGTLLLPLAVIVGVIVLVVYELRTYRRRRLPQYPYPPR